MSSLLRLLIIAAFLNALSWVILIPVWQYPDEQAHFAQVQYIAEIGGIPQNNRSHDTSFEVAISEKILGTERDDLGNNKFTYHPQFKLNYSNTTIGPDEEIITSLPESAKSQMVKNEATLNPPLYYSLAASVYKVFSRESLFTRVLAVRIMSAIIFLGIIIVAYKIGQLIFAKDKILPIALAAIVATKPMLVFSSTGVLPDTLVIFLFSLFILAGLSIISKGWTFGKIFLLITILILGAATRQNFLISLFILPLVFLYQVVINVKARTKIIISISILIVILFIASYFIPALDFIHRFDYPESSRKIRDNPLWNLTFFDHLTWTLRHSITEVWPWYWGVYKWLSLTLPPIVYQIINRVIPLAIVGVGIRTLIIVKRKDWRNGTWLFFFIVTITVYFLAITTFDFLYRRNNGFSFGIQGRYFFPVIIPVLALILTGISRIFEMFSQNIVKFGTFLFVFAFFIFNDFSLAYVSSSYYLTFDLEIFVKHASQYKPELFKGNIILVIIALAIIFQTIFLANFWRFIIRTGEAGEKYIRGAPRQIYIRKLTSSLMK